MLPSLYRLPKKEFIQTMRRGIRLQKDGIQYVYTQTNMTRSRLGMLVTKKFSKKAVERNHIKRQITAAFLPYLKQKNASKDIICKIVQPIPHNSLSAMANTFDRVLHTKS